ncbi:MAG: hypothetical protein ACI81P_000648 [Neolewinella sp.]|jgi:hypothetical protein
MESSVPIVASVIPDQVRSGFTPLVYQLLQKLAGVTESTIT